MKRTFLILFFVLCNIYSGIAQYQYTQVNTVRTPNGSTVTDTGIFTGTDVSFNTAQLAALANQIVADYNGAVLVGAPTYKYNCHAYAWHITEGGSNVWIGLSGTTTHNIYWTDGSYIEVPENAAAKVVYTGNHSAIRINSDWYQSKWGANALVRHHPNDVPLGYLPSSQKHYYIRPRISGPDYIANGTNVFYNISIPTGTSFNGWTISPSSYTVTGGTTNTTLNIKFNAATIYNVSAKFTLSNGVIYTSTKSVNVISLAIPDVYGWYNGTDLRLSVMMPQMGVSYKWEVNGSIVAQGSATEIGVYDWDGSITTVRCQAYAGLGNSAWSNTIHFEMIGGNFSVW